MDLRTIFKEEEISRAISLQESQDIMEEIKSKFSSVPLGDGTVFSVNVITVDRSVEGCRFSLDEIREFIEPFGDGNIRAVRVEAIFKDSREPKVILLTK